MHKFQLVPFAFRNLCGFLNSGLGGTVYVGILDTGIVEGVRLTQYQQDHMLLSLQDVMNAFKPSVPRFMYNTEFVPVLEPQDEYPCQLYVGLHAQFFCSKSNQSLKIQETTYQTNKMLNVQYITLLIISIVFSKNLPNFVSVGT
jgi:hypothetical protein